MDAVSRDDHIGLSLLAVCETHDSFMIILLEANTLVARSDGIWRQSRRQHAEQIGPVNTIKLYLIRKLGRPHRRRVGSIRAKELRVQPARPRTRQLIAEAESPQHAYPVRL